MRKTSVQPILIALPIAWMVALAAAVFVASRASVGMAAYAFSTAVYEIGSLLCHQLPERSFYFRGAQWPVCARCTGLYVGAAVAGVVATRMRRSKLQRRLWDRAKELLFAGAIPTAVTLIYEWFSGNMPSHWIRAAAGFPLGAIVMLIVVAAATPESAVEIH
jgi:uncharacterized membrane protein